MSEWFTDALLIVIYIALAAAVASVVISAILSAKHRSSDANKVNGINASLVAWLTAACVAACLVLTYVMGSSQPMVIGGEEYVDTFRLKAAEMFINTAAIQLVAIIILASALPIVCRLIRK